MKINRALVQRITSALIFLTGFVFAILGVFGVQVTVNQADINIIIFGLSSVVAALIEFGPLVYGLVKDKNVRELLSIVNDVVYAVEESKGLSGPEKKRKALEAIATICEERNIIFDAVQVDQMIESVIAIYNTVVKK